MPARKLRVAFAALAQDDFERILAYTYREWGSSEEQRMSDQLSNTIDTISGNPYIGERRSDLRPGIRCFPSGQHLILYRPYDDHIEIIRIAHSRMDISSLQFDE
jgi:toxin ParE1/3/4